MPLSAGRAVNFCGAVIILTEIMHIVHTVITVWSSQALLY